MPKAQNTERVSNGVKYRGEVFPGFNKPKKNTGGGKAKMKVLARKGDAIKVVAFGHKDYQDFRQHKDAKRRANYLKRSAGIRGKGGKLTKDDKFSANYWARRVLW